MECMHLLRGTLSNDAQLLRTWILNKELDLSFLYHSHVFSFWVAIDKHQALQRDGNTKETYE